MRIEVLMSCYKNDDPIYLREAIFSTFEKQSIKPESFRIVVDGPVGDDINAVLEEYKNKYPDIFIVQRLAKNVGLGLALRAGIIHSDSEYILRMDSDDVSHPNRIEKLRRFAEDHPDIGVIGSYTAEFIDCVDNLLSVRELKTENDSIYNDEKKRTPVSHVSVLLKREAVISSGNYQHFSVYEDYYLWIRMIRNGIKFANLPEVLVYVRTDEKRYKRKGSKTYIKSTIRFQHFLYGIGFINYKEYLRNKYGRVFVAILPVWLRKIIYEKYLRKQPKLKYGE